MIRRSFGRQFQDCKWRYIKCHLPFTFICLMHGLRRSNACVKWFGVVRGVVCTANVQEEERLGEQDFSQLLHKAVFHKCLLACCIEVVLVTYECQSQWEFLSSRHFLSLTACHFIEWIYWVMIITQFLQILEGRGIRPMSWKVSEMRRADVINFSMISLNDY